MKLLKILRKYIYWVKKNIICNRCEYKKSLNLKIGDTINNWTILEISNKFNRTKIKLKCKCGFTNYFNTNRKPRQCRNCEFKDRYSYGISTKYITHLKKNAKKKKLWIFNW